MLGWMTSSKYSESFKRWASPSLRFILISLSFEAILHRITRKFEGVRSEVRFGRNALLSEAYEDLLQMRNQRSS